MENCRKLECYRLWGREGLKVKELETAGKYEAGYEGVSGVKQPIFHQNVCAQASINKLYKAG